MDILKIFDKINEFTGKILERNNCEVDSSCNNFGIDAEYNEGMYLTEKGIIKRFKVKTFKDEGEQWYKLCDKKITPIVIYPVRKLFVDSKIELELSDINGFKRMMDDECMTTLSKFKTFIQSFGKSESWFDGTIEDVVAYHKLINRIEKELNLKTEKLNSKLGWNNNEFAPYDCGIYTDDEELKIIMDGFTPKGNKDKWIELVEDYRKNIIFESMFLTSLSAPMLSKFKFFPVMVHYSGKKSYGKTAAMRVCESIYGDPEKLEISWNNASIVPIENALNFMNNIPLFINDSQLMNYKKINPTDVVYMSIEGKGRNRGTIKGNNRKLKRWCTNVISSGEKSLLNDNSFEGANKRCIQINGRVMELEKAKDVYDIFPFNYGHIGEQWINIIKKSEIEEVLKIKKYIYENIRNDINFDENILQVTTMCIAKYLYDINILNVNKEICINNVIQTGKNILELIEVTNENEDMCNKIIKYLKDFVAQNYSRFSENDIGSYERFGFIKNGNVCFFNNKLNEILIREFNYDTKLFRKEIKERNYVVLDKNSQIKLIKYEKTTDRYPQFLKEIIFGEEEKVIELPLQKQDNKKIVSLTYCGVNRNYRETNVTTTKFDLITTNDNELLGKIFYDENYNIIIPEFEGKHCIETLLNNLKLYNNEYLVKGENLYRQLEKLRQIKIEGV